jgi:hypothetical protein
MASLEDLGLHAPYCLVNVRSGESRAFRVPHCPVRRPQERSSLLLDRLLLSVLPPLEGLATTTMEVIRFIGPDINTDAAMIAERA